MSTAHPEPLDIGPRRFVWGQRTFVMGDPQRDPKLVLRRRPAADRRQAGATETEPVARAVEQARVMAGAGADILDVGGESTRPGHAAVDASEELLRVCRS